MQLLKVIAVIAPLFSLAMATASPFAMPQNGQTDAEIVTQCVKDSRCQFLTDIGETCAKDIKDLDISKIKECTCKAIKGKESTVLNCLKCYKEKGYSSDTVKQYNDICKPYGISISGAPGCHGANWVGLAAGAIVAGGMVL
ncbi:hypothetical protein DFH27DRAFT_46249 [Peziza echinospora]|nr:hypothetical protein DFH27DRAFT_46249 [Peziza echinospora]